MGFEQTWRWFGPKDPITLKEIRQTGATGIVTALHHIPAGQVWSVDDIMKRKEMIEGEGLTWSVVESLPVHEDIKRHNGRFQEFIEHYKESIRNLGKCGIDTVCYNFMPVLDWSRTDLQVTYKDGSITTKFEAMAFAVFDLFLLKRVGAEEDYSAAQLSEAHQYAEGLGPHEKMQLVESILLGLPGSLEAFSLVGLRAALNKYAGIGDRELREHLYYFIKQIVPAAAEAGVLMAIHPDDPPWPLLGLPRVVSNARDVEQILAAFDSPSNGITLCTGSFGAGIQNDLVGMAERFGPRINFVHLRNLSRTASGDFVEEDHLGGDIDMYGVVRALLIEQKRRLNEGLNVRRMPMRPDHGHLMLPDRDRRGIYPGYSLFGRMRGLAELRGLELGIQRSLGL